MSIQWYNWQFKVYFFFKDNANEIFLFSTSSLLRGESKNMLSQKLDYRLTLEMKYFMKKLIEINAL